MRRLEADASRGVTVGELTPLRRVRFVSAESVAQRGRVGNRSRRSVDRRGHHLSASEPVHISGAAPRIKRVVRTERRDPPFKGRAVDDRRGGALRRAQCAALHVPGRCRDPRSGRSRRSGVADHLRCRGPHLRSGVRPRRLRRFDPPRAVSARSMRLPVRPRWRATSCAIREACCRTTGSTPNAVDPSSCRRCWSVSSSR